MPETPALKTWLLEYGPAEGVKPGQPCYGLAEGTGRPSKCYEGKIVKAGREYLTTDIFRNARFRVQDIDSPYLIDADCGGLVDKLFLSEQDRADYLRREDLASKFVAGQPGYRDSATARQLETAMAVLERASDPLCKKILALIEREA